jgi:hypothetical protein
LSSLGFGFLAVSFGALDDTRPTFISECCWGGIRISAPIIRFAADTSSESLAMAYIPPEEDVLNLTYTFAYGLTEQRVPVISTPSISEVYTVFIKNTARLKSMMVFPAHIAQFAGAIQRIGDVAEFEFAGTLTVGPQAMPPETKSQVFERSMQLFQQYNNRIVEAYKDPIKRDDFLKDAMERGAGIAVSIVRTPAAESAFEFAFMSYLTSAWTAFETMAGDLWEAALNEHPIGLADLQGKKRDKKSSNPSSNNEVSENKKLVKLDLLRSHNWDTKNKMGTILKEKFAFTTLGGIREAYASAFHKDFDDIDTFIFNESLDRLSALRNVIVHKGGIADSEYVRRAKDFSALPQTKAGEKVILDGKMVADLIADVIVECAGLAQKVDMWLLNHSA